MMRSCDVARAEEMEEMGSALMMKACGVVRRAHM